ncbi:MAG TPA: protease pro-enzyme activation domain-containing protein, partial [Longimicrobium sp.]|nr:protease pro-enzyme activation domain-containing protein [Longimicrobium sp.]
MTQPEHHVIQGSERSEIEGGRVVGPVADSETVDVTVRLRAPGELDTRADAAPLTRAELAERHGSSPEDVRAVEAFAHAHGLTVLDASPAEHAVRLRGTARAMQDAFGVLLQRVEHA